MNTNLEIKKEINVVTITKRALFMIPNPNINRKSPQCVGLRVKWYGPWRKVSELGISFLRCLEVFCAQRIKSVASTNMPAPSGTIMEFVKILNLKIRSR
jgi:hypothetical protein